MVERQDKGASASQTGLPPASRAEPVVSGKAGIPSALSGPISEIAAYVGNLEAEIGRLHELLSTLVTNAHHGDAVELARFVREQVGHIQYGRKSLSKAAAEFKPRPAPTTTMIEAGKRTLRTLLHGEAWAGDADADAIREDAVARIYASMESAR